MATFVRSLPQPRQQSLTPTVMVGNQGVTSSAVVSATAHIPPYGKRKGWVPRKAQDFGDGGAFPEISVVQYPLNMGRANKTGFQSAESNKTVALQRDVNGKIAWDAIVKQGKASDKLAIYTRADSMKEKWSKPESLGRPEEEVDEANTNRTALALQAVLEKNTAKTALNRQERKEEIVKFTPNKDAPGYNPNCATRAIKVVERQIDPLEPPKFKHKKVPAAPGTPPPPVHQSPPRKLTAQDQAEWKIPPCVSIWKNQQGYIIPLDKRIAADGRNLQDHAMSDGHAELVDSLHLAELKAREDLRLRQKIMTQANIKKAEANESDLMKLAQESRAKTEKLAERANYAAEKKAEEGDERIAKDIKYRQEILRERQRETTRDFRLEQAGKKNQRERERDISEKVALGQAAQATKQETLYDTRLFNQSAGMDSGFGSDDKYDVFDKALFAEKNGNSLYKFDKERVEQMEGRLGRIGGPSEEEERTVPVQFEAAVEEHDPFGLERLAKRAKRG